ncbi:hypothetical protein, partial [Prevotella sp. HJM029]|uniref:hypothetical protein n=1 Tax=Prevotella sp. HJM029 TaxID=1433844 RepID=UPI0005635448
RSLDCSNERFGLKKGGYLLYRIALFDMVYHWTNWAVEGKQKKRSLDCSNERFVRKKAATYSPALPYLTRCTIGRIGQ